MSRRKGASPAGKSWKLVYATAKDVVETVQRSLDEEPPEGFENALRLLPLVHPNHADLKRTSWLVDGWLRAGGTAILSGLFKNLKSFFARQLALSVASGQSFLGVHQILESARGKPVVLVCAEESYNEVLWALLRAAEGMGLTATEFETLPIRILPALGESLFARHRGMGTIRPSDRLRAITRACELIQPSLIVFDPLVALTGDANENSSDDMRPVFTGLRQVGARVHATVLIVDHEGFDAMVVGVRHKRRRPRGSSDKLGAVDDAISLSATTKRDGRYEINARLMHRGASMTKQEITVLFEDPDGPIHFGGTGCPLSAVTIGDEGKALLRQLSSGPVDSKRKLQERLDLKSPDQLTDLLNRHKQLVEIESHGKGRSDLVSLSSEGRDLARKLELEVLSEEGAQ